MRKLANGLRANGLRANGLRANGLILTVAIPAAHWVVSLF